MIDIDKLERRMTRRDDEPLLPPSPEEVLEMIAEIRRLRGLETAAKARVYKAAVDQIADSMAAGAWQDGPAPKDGSWILGLFHGLPYVVGYDSWEVGGEMLPDGTGSPPDGHESGWCLAGDNIQVMDQDEPEKWARIIHPNRHMPASWDGPGDYLQVGQALIDERNAMTEEGR